ncbi:MAG: hypothetical protein E7497_05325 [Ruminococcus sp.]|nr:hypothetical protein [Ruminococcus sp.]
MGTQFWWFFDAVTAAIVLVAVFLAGRKGFAKTLIMVIGCAASVLLGVALSGAVSNFAYDSAIEHGNVKNIKETLTTTDLSDDTIKYIEGLGYNVKLNDKKITEIFLNGGDINGELYKYVNNINGKTVDTEENFRKNMTQGFAEIMGAMFTEALSDFAGEVVYDKILNDMSKLPKAIALVEAQAQEADVTDYSEAANFLEQTYSADAYKEMISLIAFAAVSLVVLLVVMNISRKMNEGDSIGRMGDIADHVIGGFFGLIEAAVFMLIIAALIKLVVMFGSDDMILFNEQSINKTYVFKHIYKFTDML